MAVKEALFDTSVLIEHFRNKQFSGVGHYVVTLVAGTETQVYHGAS